MNIKDHFPRASKSFLEANPAVVAVVDTALAKNDVQVNSVPNGGRIGHSSGFDMVPFGRKGMNKTEAEYSRILEAMKRKGEILRYEFEGITLRFAGVKYTPDFVVFVDKNIDWSGVPAKFRFVTPSPKFIEVKGPFIKGNRERAIERFRHAKTYWPEFTFEMHQKTKEGWKQII